MDSFMNNIKTASHDDTKSNPDHQSNPDLMSSAKLVTEAAQSAATNKTDQIDKAKVAGATADLLDSAKQYGKFDESQGVGQYLKQADDYLHQYEKSSATPPAEAPPGDKKAEAAPVAEEKGESESGIGAGDAMKAAGNFFK